MSNIQIKSYIRFPLVESRHNRKRLSYCRVYKAQDIQNETDLRSCHVTRRYFPVSDQVWNKTLLYKNNNRTNETL